MPYSSRNIPYQAIEKPVKIYTVLKKLLCFPGGLEVKASAHNAGDLGSIPGLERSPGEGMATHSSILAWRIPVDRGAWWATVHGVVGVGHYWVINTFTYIQLKILNAVPVIYSPCGLSILYIVVYMCSSQVPNLSLPPPLSSLVTISFICSVCFCFVNKFICVIF